MADPEERIAAFFEQGRYLREQLPGVEPDPRDWTWLALYLLLKRIEALEARLPES